MPVYFLENFDFEMINNELRLKVPNDPKFKNKIVFIMIKAEWCGHCQTTTPEVIKLSEMVGDDFIICFADITGKRESERLIKDMTKNFPNFRGFPHIGAFKYGKYVDLKSNRKAESFHEALKKLKMSQE